MVTFLFERNSRSDAPTNARIYRIRSDLSWDDVVQSFQNDRQYSKGMQGVCREGGEGRGGIRRRRQKGRGRKEGARVIEESSFSSCLQSSRSSLH